MARWKDRRVTALEREMADALADMFEELELDPDEADWPAIYRDMREAFLDLGRDVSAILVETMPAAVANNASIRSGLSCACGASGDRRSTD